MKPIFNENLLISLKTKIFIKKKVINNLNFYLKKFKNKKTLVLLDDYLKNNHKKRTYIYKSLNFIKNKKIIINSFYEPTFLDLEKIIKSIKGTKFELIIGIGGGSTIDVAKGLSASMNYKKNIRNLQGIDKFDHEPIPVVAIPSIFGSGAEITPSAVFINEKTKIKGGINSEKVQPKYAFLDPYLAKSKNLKQHATCAFDALVHSLESYESNISNNFTKSFALNGSIKVISGLKLLNKNELEALTLIAEGSIYSIISLMHSEQSLAGAASYPLAAYYGYNHALCGASFIDKSLKFFHIKNKKYLNDVIFKLHDLGIIKNRNIKSLIDELKMIKNEYMIENIMLNKSDITFLANQIIKMPMIKHTPIKINKNDIMKFLSYV